MSRTYYELVTICKGRTNRRTKTEGVSKEVLIGKAHKYIKEKRLKGFAPNEYGEWGTQSCDRLFWVTLTQIHTDGKRATKKNITKVIFDTL